MTHGYLEMHEMPDSEASGRVDGSGDELREVADLRRLQRTHAVAEGERMIRPSELLSNRVDPIALFWLGRDILRYAGKTVALQRADYYASVAKALPETDDQKRTYQIVAGAIYEAVENAEDCAA